MEGNSEPSWGAGISPPRFRTDWGKSRDAEEDQTGLQQGYSERSFWSRFVFDFILLTVYPQHRCEKIRLRGRPVGNLRAVAITRVKGVEWRGEANISKCAHILWTCWILSLLGLKVSNLTIIRFYARTSRSRCPVGETIHLCQVNGLHVEHILQDLG
jgi:hypothetical protein